MTQSDKWSHKHPRQCRSAHSVVCVLGEEEGVYCERGCVGRRNGGCVDWEGGCVHMYSILGLTFA